MRKEYNNEQTLLVTHSIRALTSINAYGSIIDEAIIKLENSEDKRVVYEAILDIISNNKKYGLFGEFENEYNLENIYEEIKKIGCSNEPFEIDQTLPYVIQTSISADWVSDALNSIWQFWMEHDLVLISATTGMGKNYFITNSIVNTIINNNKTFKRDDKILLLSNRVALNIKNKKDIAKTVHQEKLFDMYSEKGIRDNLIQIGPVCIMSYHQFLDYAKASLLDKKDVTQLNRSLKKYGMIEDIKFEDFSHIFLDEAHFFVQDALFNPKTSLIFETILSQNTNAVKIFMSATTDELLPILNDTAKTMHHSLITIAKENKLSDYLNGNLPHVNVRHYILQDTKPVMDRYITETDFLKTLPVKIKEFFTPIIDEEKLINNINENTDKEKSRKNHRWLIFVSSINRGYDLIDEINRVCKTIKNDITIKFIHADNKSQNEDFINNMLKNQSFDCDILITTTMLDNGISISDPNVLNVAIDLFDQTTTIQCAGRVRYRQDGTIIFHMQKYDSDLISKRKRECERIIELFQNLKRREITTDELINRKITGVWYLNGNTPRYNKFSRIKAENEARLLKSFKKEYADNPLCVFQKQCQWLNIENSIYQQTLDKKQKRILDLLSEYSNIPMIDFKKSILTDLGTKFKEIYQEEYNDRTSDRKTRIYGLSVMNDCLFGKNIPAFIFSDNNYAKNDKESRTRYRIIML